MSIEGFEVTEDEVRLYPTMDPKHILIVIFTDQATFTGKPEYRQAAIRTRCQLNKGGHY